MGGLKLGSRSNWRRRCGLLGLWRYRCLCGNLGGRRCRTGRTSRCDRTYWCDGRGRAGRTGRTGRLRRFLRMRDWRCRRCRRGCRNDWSWTASANWLRSNGLLDWRWSPYGFRDRRSSYHFRGDLYRFRLRNYFGRTPTSDRRCWLGLGRRHFGRRCRAAPTARSSGRCRRGGSGALFTLPTRTNACDLIIC